MRFPTIPIPENTGVSESNPKYLKIHLVALISTFDFYSNASQESAEMVHVPYSQSGKKLLDLIRTGVPVDSLKAYRLYEFSKANLLKHDIHSGGWEVFCVCWRCL